MVRWVVSMVGGGVAVVGHSVVGRFVRLVARRGWVHGRVGDLVGFCCRFGEGVSLGPCCE